MVHIWRCVADGVPGEHEATSLTDLLTALQAPRHQGHRSFPLPELLRIARKVQGLRADLTVSLQQSRFQQQV